MISIKSGIFEFFIEFLSDGTLPKFRGSTIRGALGYQLKKTLCHTKQKDCYNCLIFENCLYKKIFEGLPPVDRKILRKYPSIPQSFILEVKGSDKQQVESGDVYCFSIRLFGEATSYLPYIVYSLIQIGKSGLGKDRLLFNLNRVVQILQDNTSKELYSHQDSNITKPKTEILVWNNKEGKNGKGILSIEFITPTKYRYNGSLSTDTNFSILFKTIVRRTRIMCYFYGESLENKFNRNIYDLSQKIKTIKNETTLSRFTRISGRQNKRIEMSGIVGKTLYEGDFNYLIPYLKASEVLHIGKSTSFGFGKVNVNFEGVSNAG